MSDWTEGYVDEVGYTYGYYPELNPLRSRLALLQAGVACPEIRVACELGFGQGVSVNIHAAASTVEWWGADFNPAHANFAQSLAEASGARLYDDAFADFCRRPDLPDFDFIDLHGIWSWISSENQSVIVDFVRRKLRPGGVLYISYNAMPGWANLAPLRRLMSAHTQIMGAPGLGVAQNIDTALAFTDALLETQPAFARAQPLVAEFHGKMKEQDRHYLAHEYLNRDWRPMYFSEINECLKQAKISYVCSANYMDHLVAANLSPQQVKFLEGIPDLIFREEARDFISNQQFRRDYWIKGGRRMRKQEQYEAFRRQRAVLVADRSDVVLKARGQRGEFTMTEAVYAPVVDLLADHKARTLDEIAQALQSKGLDVAQVVEVVLVLTAVGYVAPAYAEEEIAAAIKTTDALNKTLIERARFSEEVGYLASPVIGGAVRFPRVNQLFLRAIEEGRRQPGDLARYVWDILNSQGQALVKDGAALEGDQANVAELTRQAEAFAAKGLPLASALKVS